MFGPTSPAGKRCRQRLTGHLIFPVVVLIALASCSQSVQSKRNAWEKDIEQFVGEPISKVFFIKESEIRAAGNQTQFIYRSENSSCVWAYLVDSDTMIIESWEILENPDDCYWRTKPLRTIGRN